MEALGSSLGFWISAHWAEDFGLSVCPMVGFRILVRLRIVGCRIYRGVHPLSLCLSLVRSCCCFLLLLARHGLGYCLGSSDLI